MWAITIKGKELTIVERPTPEPGRGDVVVAVRGAGLNAADLMQRQGFYPAPSGAPVDVPGMELAGEVSALGEGVDAALLGRRVCALVGGGAQASHCLVASEHLLFVPDRVGFDEAAGFAEAFATAHDALVSQAHVQRGERVLISGAAGGVGVAGVQIARVLGAEVIAATRTSEHHEQLRALGASDTVTVDEVAALQGVDVVLELLGAADLVLAQRVLNARARVVVIGVGAGRSVDLDLLNVMATRATITGSTMRGRSRAEKSEVTRLVAAALVPRWADGELEVPIARVFDLEDADAAYRYFAQPGKFGKVVLRVGGRPA